MRNLLICLTFLSVSFGCINVAVARVDRDVVSNEITAIKIASAILEDYMGEDRFEATIRHTPLKAELHGDVWSVFFYPADSRYEVPQKNGTPTVAVVAGGGLPVVELSKHDAQVRSIYLAR